MQFCHPMDPDHLDDPTWFDQCQMTTYCIGLASTSSDMVLDASRKFNALARLSQNVAVYNKYGTGCFVDANNDQLCNSKSTSCEYFETCPLHSAISKSKLAPVTEATIDSSSACYADIMGGECKDIENCVFHPKCNGCYWNALNQSKCNPNSTGCVWKDSCDLTLRKNKESTRFTGATGFYSKQSSNNKFYYTPYLADGINTRYEVKFPGATTLNDLSKWLPFIPSTSALSTTGSFGAPWANGKLSSFLPFSLTQLNRKFDIASPAGGFASSYLQHLKGKAIKWSNLVSTSTRSSKWIDNLSSQNRRILSQVGTIPAASVSQTGDIELGYFNETKFVPWTPSGIYSQHASIVDSGLAEYLQSSVMKTSRGQPAVVPIGFVRDSSGKNIPFVPIGLFRGKQGDAEHAIPILWYKNESTGKYSSSIPTGKFTGDMKRSFFSAASSGGGLFRVDGSFYFPFTAGNGKFSFPDHPRAIWDLTDVNSIAKISKSLNSTDSAFTLVSKSVTILPGKTAEVEVKVSTKVVGQHKATLKIGNTAVPITLNVRNKVKLATSLPTNVKIDDVSIGMPSIPNVIAIKPKSGLAAVKVVSVESTTNAQFEVLPPVGMVAVADKNGVINVSVRCLAFESGVHNGVLRLETNENDNGDTGFEFASQYTINVTCTAGSVSVEPSSLTGAVSPSVDAQLEVKLANLGNNKLTFRTQYVPNGLVTVTQYKLATEKYGFMDITTLEGVANIKNNKPIALPFKWILDNATLTQLNVDKSGVISGDGLNITLYGGKLNGGNVTYRLTTYSVTIQFSNCKYSKTPVTFQVILEASGAIRVNSQVSTTSTDAFVSVSAAGVAYTIAASTATTSHIFKSLNSAISLASTSGSLDVFTDNKFVLKSSAFISECPLCDITGSGEGVNVESVLPEATTVADPRYFSSKEVDSTFQSLSKKRSISIFVHGSGVVTGGEFGWRANNGSGIFVSDNTTNSLGDVIRSVGGVHNLQWKPVRKSKSELSKEFNQIISSDTDKSAEWATASASEEGTSSRRRLASLSSLPFGNFATKSGNKIWYPTGGWFEAFQAVDLDSNNTLPKQLKNDESGAFLPVGLYKQGNRDSYVPVGLFKTNNGRYTPVALYKKTTNSSVLPVATVTSNSFVSGTPFLPIAKFRANLNGLPLYFNLIGIFRGEEQISSLPHWGHGMTRQREMSWPVLNSDSIRVADSAFISVGAVSSAANASYVFTPIGVMDGTEEGDFSSLSTIAHEKDGSTYTFPYIGTNDNQSTPFQPGTGLFRSIDSKEQGIYIIRGVVSTKNIPLGSNIKGEVVIEFSDGSLVAVPLEVSSQEAMPVVEQSEEPVFNYPSFTAPEEEPITTTTTTTRPATDPVVIDSTSPLLQFTRIPGKALLGFNDEIVKSVDALTCATQCLAKAWCKSFDYEVLTSTCKLSKESRITQKTAFVESTRGWVDYYEKFFETR